MINYQITFSFENVIYLNAESTDARLIMDIEKAVKKVIQEHYPNVVKESRAW